MPRRALLRRRYAIPCPRHAVQCFSIAMRGLSTLSHSSTPLCRRIARLRQCFTRPIRCRSMLLQCFALPSRCRSMLFQSLAEPCFSSAGQCSSKAYHRRTLPSRITANLCHRAQSFPLPSHFNSAQCHRVSSLCQSYAEQSFARPIIALPLRIRASQRHCLALLCLC